MICSYKRPSKSDIYQAGSQNPNLQPFSRLDLKLGHSKQSEDFAIALQSAGVEVELVLLPYVSHNSILNNPDTISAMEDFLIRLVK